eukprot:TRINITY_DN19074_c0_g1_i1.p1 TRINITY_DN19074_c0_g1~~TRINITY_DN19074_c0_g1_i1.p1  ORF type:complete len:102 (-),score=12.67 TRINITY_DN19074_c0_g1_i1:134-439(-)
MALVMRIKFPPTYPLIYKTLRIDSKLTASEAITFISETLNVPVVQDGSIGLYLPQENIWLDDNTPLSSYDELQEAEEVELKIKGGAKNTKQNEPGPCCTLF